MSRYSRALLWLVFLMGAPCQALELAEFGILNVSFPSIGSTMDSSLSASPGVAMGAGFTVGLTLWDDWVIETGLGYVIRAFNETSQATGAINVATPSLQLPLLVRYRAFEHFSFGLGGYFSHFAGDASITRGDSTLVTQISAVSRSQNEAGGMASIRAQTPINELMSFVVDGRFLMGLTNSDTDQGTTYMARDVQIWAGISYIL